MTTVIKWHDGVMLRCLTCDHVIKYINWKDIANWDNFLIDLWELMKKYEDL
jgi:hypothetical protein